MRTFIVGDIHGCADEFAQLLKAAEFSPGDQLVLAGDLVNKGPDSAGVLAIARDHQAVGVLGNHDAALIDGKRTGDLKPFQERTCKDFRPLDWYFLEQLPLVLPLKSENALVVHAGVIPGLPLKKQPRHVLLNMRSLKAGNVPSNKVIAGAEWTTRYQGPEHIFFGHDAVRGLQQTPFATGLDTGCVYGRELTGIWLQERRLVQVKAKKAYLAVGKDSI